MNLENEILGVGVRRCDDCNASSVAKRMLDGLSVLVGVRSKFVVFCEILTGGLTNSGVCAARAATNSPRD